MKDNAAKLGDEKQTASRGVLWLTIAKLYFTFSGVLLLTLLPKWIGSTEIERAKLYGDFSVVIGVLNPLTMMMITGTIQAVSKFISEDETRFAGVKTEALKLQTVLGLFFAGLFFLLSDFIAATLLHDAALALPMKTAAPIIFAYALYAALIGTLNGRKRFFAQASMDIAFATLKIGLILTLAYLGYGVLGAIGGFTATALIMTFVAFFVAGHGVVKSSISWREILRFEAWIMLFALGANLLMNLDLYLVKALLEDEALVGVYSVALQVARLPYIAVISVTFVIFPLISKTTYKKDKEGTKNYIQTTTRYTLIIAGSLALTLSATAADLLRLVFTEIFQKGAGMLSLLAVGYFAYSLLMIFAAMISGSGKPTISFSIAFVTLCLLSLFGWLLIPHMGGLGAAFSVLAAFFIGQALAAGYLHRRYHSGFPVLTVFRVLFTGATLYALSAFWQPQASLLIILKGILAFAFYWSLLVITREVKKADAQAFLKPFAKKKA